MAFNTNFSKLRRDAILEVRKHLRQHNLEHKLVGNELICPMYFNPVADDKRNDRRNTRNVPILLNRGIPSDDYSGSSKSVFHVLQELLAERVHHRAVLVSVVPSHFRRSGGLVEATKARIQFSPIAYYVSGKK